MFKITKKHELSKKKANRKTSIQKRKDDPEIEDKSPLKNRDSSSYKGNISKLKSLLKKIQVDNTC